MDREGADGRNGHEEGLVEEFPMGDVFESGVDDGAAQNEVGDEEEIVSDGGKSCKEAGRLVVHQHADDEEEAADGELAFFAFQAFEEGRFFWGC